VVESDRPPAGEGDGAEVAQTGDEAAVGEGALAPVGGVEMPIVTDEDVSRRPVDTGNPKALEGGVPQTTEDAEATGPRLLAPSFIERCTGSFIRVRYGQ
jgi:hypothetical protein